MTTRQAYHHGDLRNGLLDAADELLQEVGLQGFTLRACARKAGVSHAAPKHHFGDVKGLLSAIAERGFARLTDRLQVELAAVKGDLDAEMYATVHAYVGFAEAYPEHFRVMFRADLLQWDADGPPLSAQHTFMELTNVILRQRGEPEFELEDNMKPKSSSLVNDILLGWCHIHGYAHLRLEQQLNMVSEDEHQRQMKMAASRLGEMIRQAD